VAVVFFMSSFALAALWLLFQSCPSQQWLLLLPLTSQSLFFWCWSLASWHLPFAPDVEARLVHQQGSKVSLLFSEGQIDVHLFAALLVLLDFQEALFNGPTLCELPAPRSCPEHA
jgi:hypothetical protein